MTNLSIARLTLYGLFVVACVVARTTDSSLPLLTFGAWLSGFVLCGLLVVRERARSRPAQGSGTTLNGRWRRK